MAAEPASTGGPVLDPNVMLDTPHTPSRRPAAPSVGTSPMAKRLMAHVQVSAPIAPQNMGIGEITSILQKIASQQDQDHLWMAEIVKTVQDHAERIDQNIIDHVTLKKDLVKTVTTVAANDVFIKKELGKNDTELKQHIANQIGELDVSLRGVYARVDQGLRDDTKAEIAKLNANINTVAAGDGQAGGVISGLVTSMETRVSHMDTLIMETNITLKSEQMKVHNMGQTLSQSMAALVSKSELVDSKLQ